MMIPLLVTRNTGMVMRASESLSLYPDPLMYMGLLAPLSHELSPSVLRVETKSEIIWDSE
jgi:hypothetical protein